MIHVQIETDDLLKWAGYFDELPKKTPDAIARALNSVGGNVLEISVDYFAEGSGLDAADVRPHDRSAGSHRQQSQMDDGCQRRCPDGLTELGTAVGQAWR